MAVPTSRKFSLLLLVSVCILFFLFSWEHLSSSSSKSLHISWATISEKNRYRVEEMFDFWGEKRNLSAIPNSTQSNLMKLKTRHSTRAAVAETPMPVLSKKSFNKLPQWDFEDIYNQDAPPRQMPQTCAQSLRNSEDESFKKAFLPNIRLYMHKLSVSEWNRLSHFNNPFGFMEYKYDEVMAAVNLIPKPKEPLLPPKPGGDGCVRCAVVGTAGILNGSKMGKEIDAHDYIFRMNGAVIKGYEEDVGNRTSVYVHTAHSITSSPYFFNKYGYKAAPRDEGIKYVMIPEGMRDFNWLEGLIKGERVTAGQYKNWSPRSHYAEQYNETRFYVLHQDFLRYVRNRFLKSAFLNNTYWSIVRPTNGAFTLFLALHTCDIVSAYGFMTEDYKKYSNYYFEKQTKTNVVFYSNHDYMMEMRMWKKLHDSKILKLYQTPESKMMTEKPK